MNLVFKILSISKVRTVSDSDWVNLTSQEQENMKREILNAEDLPEALATLDGWTAEGTMLKKHYKFENFASALALNGPVPSPSVS